MALWDYVAWYSSRPVWLRPFLFPIVVMILGVHIGALLALFFVQTQYGLVQAKIDNRRFWRRLRERGQVGRWSNVKSQVITGSSTLIVTVTPKGPGCSWLVDAPRDAVDPEHVVPSWQQLEAQGRDIFKSPPITFALMNRWSMERLGTYASSARAIRVSWKELSELDVEVKERSVLAVLPWLEGALVRRCG